jgi:hypothetical protein
MSVCTVYTRVCCTVDAETTRTSIQRCDSHHSDGGAPTVGDNELKDTSTFRKIKIAKLFFSSSQLNTQLYLIVLRICLYLKLI